MKEQALLFGEPRSLVGIATCPVSQVGNSGHPTAVVLLNAGALHRVGPNRIYVALARDLARLGFLTLRFDFSGIGDSRARDDLRPFRARAIAETREAMDHLRTTYGLERFVLSGICSGACVAFWAACQDPRVVGAILINARGHLHNTRGSQEGSVVHRWALIRHYWRMAFGSSFWAKNWRKALRGEVDLATFTQAISDPRPNAFAVTSHQGLPEGDVASHLTSLAERHVRLLHVYSEGDEGLDYFHAVTGGQLRKWRDDGFLQAEVIRGADHTFTLLWSQERLRVIVRGWMRSFASDGSSGAMDRI